jgi:hypothetical protein
MSDMPPVVDPAVLAGLQWLVTPTDDPTEGTVEIAFTPDGLTCMRYSATPDNVLVLTRQQWEDFAAGVRDGEFDDV